MCCRCSTRPRPGSSGACAARPSSASATRELGSDFIAYVTKAEASDGEIACFVTGYEAAVRAQALAEAQEQERAGTSAPGEHSGIRPLDGAVEVA